MALASAWLFAVTSGMAALWNYSNAPGTPADPPPAWPVASAVAPAPDRATLLMIAHPRCPCTRASIEELSRLMARVSDRVTAHVLFVEPEGAPADWTDTDLRESAARIPGVVVVKDAAGREAERFGAATSGQVVAYGRDGRLLFHGGITPERGHAGDSVGRTTLLAMLEQQPLPSSHAPVFGCELLDGASRGT